MQPSIHTFFASAQRLGPKPAWTYGSRTYSWTDAAKAVRQAARAFIALGVPQGGAVSIVGPNRPEWVIADMGAIAAGAVPAPIYPTLTAEQAAYIAAHSEAAVAVVENQAQVDKLRANRPPGLRWFVLMAGAPDAADVLSWDQFLARGEETSQQTIDQRLETIDPTSTATLIYTSGTTGPPKAVMLTHQNLGFAAETAKRIGDVTDSDIIISYLPLSHIAEQLISIHGPCASGANVVFCDNMDNLGAVLREARPTIFFGVPRVWEKLQARLEAGFAAAPALKKFLLGWARKSRSNLAEKIVLGPLRAKMGCDRIRIAASGAAKIGDGTVRFFESIGIPVCDMWGMTESCGMGSANLPRARKPGTIGKPSDGTEIAIAPDGEILTRGPHVFRGYYKDPAATAETLDAQGYLHTGDVGEIDGDGFVKITDRKKDLLITSGGKNVSPQNLEAQLGQISGVAQAVVVGDARKYLAALIVAETPEKAKDPSFRAHLEQEIEKLNGRLAKYESIKKFKVLTEPFSIASGELTPTLKLKRKAVSQKYSREIDELFA
ncbi:MAG TPA: AMP-dependent synthetase/ligase [Myxococcales bacterium]|nr:AMP-dependent synthetase/ligase [Myxococcales bacterium]